MCIYTHMNRRKNTYCNPFNLSSTTIKDMGRAKLEMKLICNEKSRNATYKKRKEGLIRKLHEFTTLCDVNACMIIYGPKGATEPEVFPQNPHQLRRIIDIYKSKNKDSGIKTYGITDFFHDREKKIEEELAKLQRKNLEARYPTKPQMLNIATEAQLREFGLLLSNKLEHVRATIEFLRRNRQTAPISLDSHNSMMMVLMNESTSAASTSSNIHLQRQVFFEPQLPPPPTRWPLPPPQPYLLPPQMLFSHQEEFSFQYEIKNQIPSEHK